MSHEELLKQIHQVMKDNGVDSVTVIADEDVLRGLNEDNIAKVLLPDSDEVFILPGATDVEIVYDDEEPGEVWAEFGDVPMNPETECIEVEWRGFPAGTHREEIWHWFEETFDVSVHDLMFP